MLCSPTSRQQRPGTFSHTVSSSNRHLNQMVARQAGTTCLSLALTLVTYSSWTKRNGLPSMPNQDISDLCHKLWTKHSRHVTCHLMNSSITTFQQTFEGAIFHCEDKQASSLRIHCPCLYYQAIDNTFQDPSIFEAVSQDPATIVTSLVDLQQQHSKAYPWAVGPGRQLPAGYILAK